MSRVQQFDFSADLLQALLWQYNDAERLQAILQSKQDWYNANQEQFWSDWVVDVFDLRTANDFGLSVWSVILEQPLTATVEPSPATQPAWGFGEFHKNFGRGNFIRSGTSPRTMTREQSRILLQLRYAQLVSRGTVPEINAILKLLFGDLGLSYVLDGHDMTMVYVFRFVPPSALFDVLDSFDILPRPAGVRLRKVIALDTSTWGFGLYHRNFDRGNFSE